MVADLYDEMQKFPSGDGGLGNPLLNLSLGGFGGGGGSGRRGLYGEILSNLRLVMVERMAKPEEVSFWFSFSSFPLFSLFLQPQLPCAVS